MRRTSCTALALTAVLTLSGCTGPTSSPRAVRGCSGVGAPEGLGVDLTTVLPFEGGDYYATTRLPGLGQEATHGFAGNDEHGLSTSVEADLSGDPVDVEVVVVTERGDVACRASDRLQPHLSQPNGAVCDGENYRVDVQATEDGQLVPLPLGGVAKDSRGRISVVVFTEHGVCSVSDAYSSYVRVGVPVDDGAGGPPPGWGVPAQRGWAAIDGDVLTFEDASWAIERCSSGRPPRTFRSCAPERAGTAGRGPPPRWTQIQRGRGRPPWWASPGLR